MSLPLLANICVALAHGSADVMVLNSDREGASANLDAGSDRQFEAF